MISQKNRVKWEMEVAGDRNREVILWWSFMWFQETLFGALGSIEILKIFEKLMGCF